MKVRYHDRPDTWGLSGNFNTHSASEVLVYFPDGDATSESSAQLDVQLPGGAWKPMNQAFEDRDIVPNNLNTWFAVPDAEQKARGYI